MILHIQYSIICIDICKSIKHVLSIKHLQVFYADTLKENCSRMRFFLGRLDKIQQTVELKATDRQQTSFKFYCKLKFADNLLSLLGYRIIACMQSRGISASFHYKYLFVKKTLHFIRRVFMMYDKTKIIKKLYFSAIVCYRIHSAYVS